jgi:hypothetical protein
MITIENRNTITQLLSANSVGCELGVFEGEYSQVLADSNKFSKLFLVDIFNGEASNFGKLYKDCSVLERYVKSRFYNNNIVEIIKNDSISFLSNLPENYLDFIYIDTVHDYTHTRQELLYSYKVIKNQKFICGHDYTIKYFPDLVAAVNDFCQEHKLELNVTSKHEDYPSFYISVNK